MTEPLIHAQRHAATGGMEIKVEGDAARVMSLLTGVMIFFIRHHGKDIAVNMIMGALKMAVDNSEDPKIVDMNKIQGSA